MDTRTFAGFDADAAKHRKKVFGRNPPDAEYFHEYYQVVILAEDQFGAPVPDFFVEFFPKPAMTYRFPELEKASHYFHDEVLEHTHVHRRHSSYCCFFIDRYDLMRPDGFYSKIPKNSATGLALTVTATDPGKNVSYFAHGVPSKRGVVDLHDKGGKNRWLQRHCTHFIKLIVPRVGAKEIFKLNRARRRQKGRAA